MQDEVLTVRMAGGLGNQLFQLAAGKSAAPKKLLLDNSRLNGSNRDFAITPILGHVNFEISNPLKITNLFAKKINESKEFTWQSIKLSKSRTNILSGYFQHPAYAESIIQDLVESAEVIDSQTSGTRCGCGSSHVAIHIRRGDYLSIPKNKRIFGVLSNQYFTSAISKFSTETHFTVFCESDIQNELLKNLSPSLRLSFAELDLEPFDLLIKMCSSDGIIMSNSSLSWWAARIGAQMKKEFRVVCPRIWFKELPDSKNLILKDWHLLDPDWIP